ncbi:PilT protein, N-terminal [Fimbriiglobus ruber]|uniref:Ribonuclease VapC n=2 Tax=Fimbriiglobus ruber TaxID=1908690 RepID=A0A225E5N5_9BACT|nr:PilT protein, N-terminal [Fimbriiglobus ruber]
MDAALLDTDILSEVIKQRNATIIAKAVAYLGQHGPFIISAFSRFEVRRGYLHKNAGQQLVRFAVFCSHSVVLPVTDAVLDRAAYLWAEARHGGHSCGDADLSIAASALEHGLVLVTGNLRHFAWVTGLKIEDWRTP